MERDAINQKFKHLELIHKDNLKMWNDRFEEQRINYQTEKLLALEQIKTFELKIRDQ